MFTDIDARGDGVIDVGERAVHRAGSKAGCKKEGKCGGAKQTAGSYWRLIRLV